MIFHLIFVNLLIICLTIIFFNYWQNIPDISHKYFIVKHDNIQMVLSLFQLYAFQLLLVCFSLCHYFWMNVFVVLIYFHISLFHIVEFFRNILHSKDHIKTANYNLIQMPIQQNLWFVLNHSFYQFKNSLTSIFRKS
jgi:hypothetical protein